jgi:hypothetical protein
VEQQSVFALHDEPAAEHDVPFTAQLPVESHVPEQQVSPVAHGVPNTPHGLLASGESPCLPPQATTSNARHNANQAFWIIGIHVSGCVAPKGRKVSRFRRVRRSAALGGGDGSGDLTVYAYAIG